jgi:cell division protein ZapA (FtsZ GTPase activity inhibitor)
LDREAKPVTVEILGRAFLLQGSLSPEALQAVARQVDGQLRELQRLLPTNTLADLAILVALNLAYECLETKEEYQKLQTDIEQRSQQLIIRLETHGSHVPPGP